MRLKKRSVALTVLGALLAAALILTVFTGGDRPGTGSGDAATEARAVAPFTGVDLTGENNVIIRVGATRSVVVHADDNLIDRVTTRVRSGRLLIGTTPGDLSAKSPMYVTVTVPSLANLELAGAGNISVTGIDASSLGVKLPGAGNIDATGTAAKLDVTLSGAGNARLHGLVARDAKAEISGNGTITLTATRSLDASVSGNGTIFYGGDPAKLIKKITGSGTIGPG